MEKKVELWYIFCKQFFYQNIFKTAQSFFVTALNFLKKNDQSVYTQEVKNVCKQFCRNKKSIFGIERSMQIASKLILYSLVFQELKRIILWKSRVITILFFLDLIIHTHSSNQRYRCGNFLRHVHQHKTSKDGHNHFVFSLSQVLGQSIYRCSNFFSRWNGIFCIAHGLLK